MLSTAAVPLTGVFIVTSWMRRYFLTSSATRSPSLSLSAMTKALETSNPCVGCMMRGFIERRVVARSTTKTRAVIVLITSQQM